jgi:predicted kinase
MITGYRIGADKLDTLEVVRQGYMSEMTTPTVTPSATPEVIVMIGCPGSGKTTVARDIFERDGGYWRVDGDRWKTVGAMLREAGRRPGGAGQSVVFDSTGGKRERRAGFIAWARAQNMPVRFVWVATPFETAMARNQAREKPVPAVALYTYRSRFEEPDAAAEGATEIVKLG